MRMRFIVKVGIAMVVSLTVTVDVYAGAGAKELRTAFDRGVDYLLNTGDEFISGASLLAERISVECGLDELGERARRKHEESLQHNDFLRRRRGDTGIDDGNLNKAEIDQIGRMHSGTDKAVMMAAYCDHFNHEDFQSVIEGVNRDGSYGTTHILMSLVQAEDKGCYKDQAGWTDAMIEDLVDKLKTAQEKDVRIERECSAPIVDIYAQRTHVIGDAGYPVNERWLENILNCQQEDGGWFTPHATGLCLIALANAMDGC